MQHALRRIFLGIVLRTRRAKSSREGHARPDPEVIATRIHPSLHLPRHADRPTLLRFPSLK